MNNNDCTCPDPCAACRAKLPRARTLTQMEKEMRQTETDNYCYFDFVITDGQRNRLVYARSETEALAVCKDDKAFRRGVGVWCRGIALGFGTREYATLNVQKDVFNPRAVFPPFMNPHMMDIYGYC